MNEEELNKNNGNEEAKRGFWRAVGRVIVYILKALICKG